MSSRNGSTWWHEMRRGTCLFVVGTLFLGCSKEEEGGTADFRQKFDQPTVAPPVPKEKAAPYKSLSPREKKALKKDA